MGKIIIYLMCFGFAFEFNDFDSTKIKNPKLAVLFSIIPGGGQIYNEKYIKSILFLSAECVFIKNIDNYKINNDLNNSLIEQRNSNMWWLLGIYVLNLIDAYVDAHLSAFPNKKANNKTKKIK